MTPNGKLPRHEHENLTRFEDSFWGFWPKSRNAYTEMKTTLTGVRLCARISKHKCALQVKPKFKSLETQL